MESLYNFKKYKTPRFGIFYIDTNTYKAPMGWIQEETKYKIVGETDDCYVYRLQASGYGEWVGDVVIQKQFILPIGIHKSRFIRWTSGQLSLFEENNTIS
jgi:hypothetical protein